MIIRTDRIERYYDSHPFEGEEMGQSRIHYFTILYLIAVLKFLYTGKVATVLSEINFYRTKAVKEVPQQPDLAIVPVFFTPDQNRKHPSYYVGVDGPPPPVIIEIASKKTWLADLRDKPAKYATMGVSEYFGFDPNTPSVWLEEWKKEGRLVGWKRDALSGQMVKLSKDEEGRLWSEELQSFLAVEDHDLVLYDTHRERRLTKEEADTTLIRTTQQQVLMEQARADQEQARADTAEALIKVEQAKAEVLIKVEQVKAEATLKAEQVKAEARVKAEREKAEAEREKAEAERKRAEKLAALLHELGYNLDEIS